MTRCNYCQRSRCTCGKEDWEDYLAGCEAKAENADLRTRLESASRLIEQLTAERDVVLEDAAIAKANGEHWSLAYSKWVKTDLSAKKLIEQFARIITLKSALREAKKTLERARKYQELPEHHEALHNTEKAIATINAALGEE